MIGAEAVLPISPTDTQVTLFPPQDIRLHARAEGVDLTTSYAYWARKVPPGLGTSRAMHKQLFALPADDVEKEVIL